MPAALVALLLSVFLLIGGCAQHPLATRTEVQVAAVTPHDAGVPAAPRRWSAENLQDLLVAEVAGQRDQLDLALAAYLRQAKALGSATLAERATRIALYTADKDALHQSATLWATLAPQSNEASAAAIFSLLQRDAVEEIQPLLDRLLARQVPVRFDYVVRYASQADEPTRRRVAQLLADLADAHAQNASLWLARAELAVLEEDSPAATAHVQHSLALDPRQPAAIDLQGRLLMDAGALPAARRILARGARWFTQDRALRLTYLRVLLEQGKSRAARHELQDMLNQWPGDADLQLSLALLEWETGHTERAQGMFQAMIDAGQREDDAWLYLGRIALEAGDDTSAAAHFLNVRGTRFLQARMQVASAWTRTGRIDEARALLEKLRQQRPEDAVTLWLAEADLLVTVGQETTALALLDTAVAAHPQDHDLRYGRAMVAEKLGKLDLLEQDLRAILAVTPDDATALNALGYTLADRTDRLDEAQSLIEQALLLRPDDPAILDSMGWVLFRQGKPDEALPWLQRAFDMVRDGEIAAHLGEVLWALGEKSSAQRLWKRALAQDPDSKPLQRTLERHGL